MNKLTLLNIIHVFLCIPFLFIHISLYLLSKNKSVIDKDICAWKNYRGWIPENKMIALVCLLVLQPEFRMQFNLRIGRLAKLLIFYSEERGDLGNCQHIGEGFCIIHGYGTVINGSCIIGRYCTVLQNVTIGGVMEVLLS